MLSRFGRRGGGGGGGEGRGGGGEGLANCAPNYSSYTVKSVLLLGWEANPSRGYPSICTLPGWREAL